MGKKRKPPKKQRAKLVANESQRAEAITVFWMMALLVTVLAQAIAIGAKLCMVMGMEYPALLMMSTLLLLIACVTGLLCLGLLPLVLRWRNSAPPAVIVRFAVAASCLPLVTVVGILLFGG